ncbi:MAG: DNA topoisomerase IV subunit B [Alphaproteobacteria bacterium]|nr:DNA topoisomerase IV subunit B [Alphaproteobacteria bacterium]
MSNDLFASGASAPKPANKQESYTASDIEVLEGLEPVRLRPGMYIGGTDDNALHHLVNEVFDNSMDEAVAGHATYIEIEEDANGNVTISDNGRGIPIDPHPKFPDKSALEVILTTLHSGGKFRGKVYETSGGLHGVGVSVVNALTDHLEVEVARDKKLYRQTFSRGIPQTKLEEVGNAPNRRGTRIKFHPDAEIFGAKAKFKPERLYKLARSKAYLYKGVEIRWSCAPELLSEGSEVPEKAVIRFPNGLLDFLTATLGERPLLTAEAFSGEAELADKKGRVEWAIAWPADADFDEDEITSSYCNTIPTPEGGTHANGFRTCVTKGLKSYAEMVGNKKFASFTADDVMTGAVAVLSVFIKDPHFQGQTKEKLVSTEATRLVENAIRDHFDHWLSGDRTSSTALIQALIDRAEERNRRKADKAVSRKAVTQRLRLPGKLADCSRSNSKGTELFLVEGDSAGGSAKQARNRETQAILPLRGKILNVASATTDKIRANQEIADMVLALGCGSGKHYDPSALRYEKIVIMTDADVDGAHIASLLMTFFYQEMPQIIRDGHLYLAQPPLYRITQGTTTYYAQDDASKAKLVEKLSKNRGKLEVGRFKGLGEMTAPQLKETTMDPSKRRLLRVMIDETERGETADRVNQLMGKKPELRFQFIQEQTALRGKDLADTLDV